MAKQLGASHPDWRTVEYLLQKARVDLTLARGHFLMSKRDKFFECLNEATHNIETIRDTLTS